MFSQRPYQGTVAFWKVSCTILASVKTQVHMAFKSGIYGCHLNIQDTALEQLRNIFRQQDSPY